MPFAFSVQSLTRLCPEMLPVAVMVGQRRRDRGVDAQQPLGEDPLNCQAARLTSAQSLARSLAPLHACRRCRPRARPLERHSGHPLAVRPRIALLAVAIDRRLPVCSPSVLGRGRGFLPGLNTKQLFHF